MSVKSVSPRPDPKAAVPARKAASQAPAADELDAGKVRDLTARIAFELYEKRGCVDGYDVEDWLAAETAAKARILAGEA